MYLFIYLFILLNVFVVMSDSQYFDACRCRRKNTIKILLSAGIPKRSYLHVVICLLEF